MSPSLKSSASQEHCARDLGGKWTESRTWDADVILVKERGKEGRLAGRKHLLRQCTLRKFSKALEGPCTKLAYLRSAALSRPLGLSRGPGAVLGNWPGRQAMNIRGQMSELSIRAVMLCTRKCEQCISLATIVVAFPFTHQETTAPPDK